MSSKFNVKTKKCTCCGKIHNTADIKQFIGYMEGPQFDVMLFNCECGSTLALKLEEKNDGSK